MGDPCRPPSPSSSTRAPAWATTSSSLLSLSQGQAGRTQKELTRLHSKGLAVSEANREERRDVALMVQLEHRLGHARHVGFPGRQAPCSPVVR